MMTEEELDQNLIFIMKGEWENVSPVFLHPFFLSNDELELIENHLNSLTTRGWKRHFPPKD
jgi:hypothetical protein